MSVTIRYRKSSSKKENIIIFDIYSPPTPRYRQFPGLKLIINPNNELDKQRNKEIVFTAKSMRNEIEQELLSGKYIFGSKKKQRVNLIWNMKLNFLSRLFLFPHFYYLLIQYFSICKFFAFLLRP